MTGRQGHKTVRSTSPSEFGSVSADKSATDGAGAAASSEPVPHEGVVKEKVEEEVEEKIKEAAEEVSEEVFEEAAEENTDLAEGSTCDWPAGPETVRSTSFSGLRSGSAAASATNGDGAAASPENVACPA